VPQLADIIIIGGGVIGCSIAYHLAKDGFKATVLERDAIASGASGVAAGMLTVSIEHLRAGPQFDLGLASLKIYPETLKAVHEASGIDPEYIQAGSLKLAYTEQEELEIQKTIEDLKGYLDADWVPGDDILKTEPELSPRIRGGMFTPGEKQVRGGRLTQAYAQAAASEGRVLFRFGAQVSGLTYQGQRVTGVRLGDGSHLSADHVVLAAGAWSGFVAESIGIALPVRPVRGQIISLYRVPRPLKMCIFSPYGYLTPKVDGTVLLGATYEEVGFDLRTTAAGINTLLTGLPLIAPSLADAEVREVRVGLRPGTPDGAPILGPVPGWEGITLATGHFRSGILLSPITGRLITELLSKGTTGIPLEPFSLARFE
jgi:glycine oxidase